ncbi:MAG: hypothetical protein EBR09_09965, partial [Proteobacteria bacterium]|nr:hypothetical protein [Pseudomonadota bacterium]
IATLRQSLGGDNQPSSASETVQYLIAMEYLKKFGEMTVKTNDKVFIPYEASGVLGSLGGISEMLKGAGAKSTHSPASKL